MKNKARIFLYYIEFFPEEKRYLWANNFQNISFDSLVDVHIELLIHFWIVFNQEYEKMSEKEWSSASSNNAIQDENIWAINLLNQIIRNEDDDLGWYILRKLWEKINPNEEKVRVMFGVGPMEDLMRHFSEKYIDDVIIWARSDEHFKRTLLEDVWGKKDWSENAKAKMKIYFDECMSEEPNAATPIIR